MRAFNQIIHERVLPVPSPYDAYGRTSRHLDSETVWRLCSAPQIVERMMSLFGPDLMLWLSSFFHKGPASKDWPEEYPWHQDITYWNLEPSITLSAWLAVTPATVENGCVEVIPGSHKRILPTVTSTDQRYSVRFAGHRADPAAVDEGNKVSLLLEPGQFFLFTERTLHRSGPNYSAEPRTGISMRVTLPMVKSYNEYPCVLLHGKDDFGFNTFAQPPQGEPDLAKWPGGLPDARRFTFDRAVPGIGWHRCERVGVIPICWTGPGIESWIALRTNGGGDQRFRCRVLYALKQSILTSLQIRINDHPLSLHARPWGRGAEFEGEIPARVLGGSEVVQVSLQVDQVARPCDVDKKSADIRSLGLAVHAIEFEPIS
jgi:hypothetical protein